MGTDVPSHLHIFACPFFFFRNALCYPEQWPFPSFLVSLTVQCPPSTRSFPNKTNQHLLLAAMADSFSTMPGCSGSHWTDIVVTFPALAHMSHKHSVFCSRASGQQAASGLNSSPCSFLHANSPSRGRSDFSESHKLSNGLVVVLIVS